MSPSSSRCVPYPPSSIPLFLTRTLARVRRSAHVWVTGVRRGPVRRTEFKFQIWSVSLGVTVCIVLPAGPNSLHRSIVRLSSLPNFLCSSLGPPSSPSRSPIRSPYIRPSPEFPPFICLSIFLPGPLSLLSEEKTSIFHIIQMRGARAPGPSIDMRCGRKNREDPDEFAGQKITGAMSPVEARSRGSRWETGGSFGANQWRGVRDFEQGTLC